jgi:GT2 family glycosyltransferase
VVKPTRVLGHIHTYNEGHVIDRTLTALLAQSYPVDRVLLVDNASTDNTLQRDFPDNVEVIRFDQNRLTSDPIICAMQFARERGYDWVWILNGDSAPRRDSLKILLEFYQSLDEPARLRTWLVASLPIDAKTGVRDDGFYVTARGLRRARPESTDTAYECDATIWSGSLYRMQAVNEVGLPRSDYAMDMAEIEYGYRGRQHGYRAFMHQASVLDHNVGGPSMEIAARRLGPLRFNLIELRPFRCYYVTRNVVHFWLHVYDSPGVLSTAYCVAKTTKLFLNFLLRPFTRSRQIAACLRGVRDGIMGKLEYRYPP